MFTRTGQDSAEMERERQDGPRAGAEDDDRDYRGARGGRAGHSERLEVSSEEKTTPINTGMLEVGCPARVGIRTGGEARKPRAIIEECWSCKKVGHMSSQGSNGEKTDTIKKKTSNDKVIQNGKHFHV